MNCKLIGTKVLVPNLIEIIIEFVRLVGFKGGREV